MVSHEKKMSHKMVMMKAFLEQAAFFYHRYFQDTMPEPHLSMGHEDDPEADPVDAHWKTNSWELLLALDGGDFAFYGDNLGAAKRQVKYGDATPKSVALAVYLLSTP